MRQEKIIGYVAKRNFKSENGYIVLSKGDMISVAEWNSLSPAFEQGEFEPKMAHCVAEEASLVAESLSFHLSGVAKFNDEASHKGVKEKSKELQHLLVLLDAFYANITK